MKKHEITKIMICVMVLIYQTFTLGQFNNIDNWEKNYYMGGWHLTTESTAISNQIANGGVRQIITAPNHKAFNVVTPNDITNDPNALAWVFPKGCFDICEQWLASDNPPYLVGPHGYFDSPGGWRWSNYTTNNHLDGTGLVPNYYITESGKFGLTLADDNCSIEINVATINFNKCDDCVFKDFKVFDYQCITQPNGEVLYYLNTFINTGFNVPVPVHIELLDSSIGSLSPATFVALPGGNVFNLVLTPFNSNMPTTVQLRFWAISPETGALCEYFVEMHIDCNERPFIADCKLEKLVIDHSSVQCIGTPTSPAYQMEVYIETNLSFNVNFLLEESNGWGTFTPNNITVVPGGIWFTLTYVPTTPSNSITLIVTGFNGELELCQARTRTRLPNCRQMGDEPIYKDQMTLTSSMTLNLYPNPADDWSVLDYAFNDLKDRSLQLVDMFGRVVQNQAINQQKGEWVINTHALAKGMYVVQIIENDKTIKTLKLIKK
jgi:hypothetical protein